MNGSAFWLMFFMLMAGWAKTGIATPAGKRKAAHILLSQKNKRQGLRRKSTPSAGGSKIPTGLYLHRKCGMTTACLFLSAWGTLPEKRHFKTRGKPIKKRSFPPHAGGRVYSIRTGS